MKLAYRIGIDGIVAYASDPSAPTAAYVANKLNLPGNPYESVNVLTRKDFYRDFLRKNQFTTPSSASFSSLAAAQVYVNSIHSPVMIKPVDSSGSKGVSKITSPEQLAAAYHYALSFSRVKIVIIEEYVERKGFQIAGDGFVSDGKLVFSCYAQEHFNGSGNPFVPVGESFPLQLPKTLHAKIHQEIDRLMSLLQMRTGALNFDIVINEREEIILMEIGPRGGGNLIADVIKYSTGVDLVKCVVNGAIGLDCNELTMFEKTNCYSSYILHSKDDGFFMDVELDSSIRKNMVKHFLFAKPGMPVKSFENSSCSLGCLILRFDSSEEMLEKMERMNELVRVRIVRSKFSHLV